MINCTSQPVSVKLKRFQRKSIPINEWIKLKCNALEFIVGKGKSVVTFNIVHTDTVFVDIYNYSNSTYIEWVADNFEILHVLADENKNHFLEIKYKDNILKIPFENLLPDKICSAFFNFGIGINKKYGVHEALSMYLQTIVEQFEAENSR